MCSGAVLTVLTKLSMDRKQGRKEERVGETDPSVWPLGMLLCQSGHTPHTVTSKSNWRLRFLQSHPAEVNKLDGMENAVKFKKPATLAFQRFNLRNFLQMQREWELLFS